MTLVHVHDCISTVAHMSYLSYTCQIEKNETCSEWTVECHDVQILHVWTQKWSMLRRDQRVQPCKNTTRVHVELQTCLEWSGEHLWFGRLTRVISVQLWCPSSSMWSKISNIYCVVYSAMGHSSAWQNNANLHYPLKCHFRPRNHKIWDFTGVMLWYGAVLPDCRVESRARDTRFWLFHITACGRTFSIVPYQVWTVQFGLQGAFAVVTKSPGSCTDKAVVLTRGTFDLLCRRPALADIKG